MSRAVASTTTTTVAPTATPVPDSISFTAPTLKKTYRVGQTVPIRIKFHGSTSGAFYKANPLIWLSLHGNAAMPGQAYDIVRVPLHTLLKNGASVKVLKEYTDLKSHVILAMYSYKLSISRVRSDVFYITK
ncbi:hypothetical protein EDD21DRAFT_349966 [Dissophora ornata]|nr:hypothetical protein BGZ58_009546 [Dissophora ornata]KAI8605513.1 hypothetical protein EDD21DRAFT_349966 [Dissophora ornata]